MPIGQKLKALIHHRETNVNKLAKSAGVSPQTVYGIIKRDNTKVDIDILQALAKELDVTLDYFAVGQSSPNSIEENSMLKAYKALDACGRQLVNAVIAHERERMNTYGALTEEEAKS